MTSSSEAHSRAVVYLQALLSQHSPGSSPHRIAERALDLAFNGSCAWGSYLEHDLLDEARHLIARQVQVKLLADRARTAQEGVRSVQSGAAHACQHS